MLENMARIPVLLPLPLLVLMLLLQLLLPADAVAFRRYPCQYYCLASASTRAVSVRLLLSYLCCKCIFVLMFNATTTTTAAMTAGTSSASISSAATSETLGCAPFPACRPPS